MHLLLLFFFFFSRAFSLPIHRAGNSLGTLGLFFAAAESLGGYLNDGEVVPPELCTLAAGVTTGALYRSVRGPRQAAAAGALGLLGAGILVVARKTISSGL